MYKWLVVIALVVPSFFIFCNYHIAKDERILNWDVAGYHVHNPALFLYQDTKQYSFYDTLNKQYFVMNGAPGRYALILDTTTHHYYNFYPCGVSILQLPAYLISDLITQSQSKYPRNGFSYYYQQGVAINTVLMTIIGCCILFLFLSYHTSGDTALVVVLSLFYGTNLYNYTFVNPGFSHNYSFSLISTLLYILYRYHRSPKISGAIFSGVIFGLLLMVRNTNIFFLPIFFIDWHELKFIRKISLSHLFIFTISALVTFSPQLWWWYQATGKLFINSYQSFAFYFHDPKILASLFSYRKGWFIYTPLALIYVISLISLLRTRKYFAIALITLLILGGLLYLNSSWNNWFFGGSFGYRPLIESYALLSLPFSLLIKHLPKYLVILLIIALSYWNIFQTLQYKKGILSSDSMNQAYYWWIIGKLTPSSDVYKYYYPMTLEDPGGYPFVNDK